MCSTSRSRPQRAGAASASSRCAGRRAAGAAEARPASRSSRRRVSVNLLPSRASMHNVICINPLIRSLAVSRWIRRGAFAAALATLLSPALASPAGAASGCQTLTGPAGGPYQDCGGGQVYNVLPPGEAGLVNGVQFASHQMDPHAADQRSMYADLLQVAPNLQPADVGRYFKQAGLTAGADDVARVYSPGAGTVIVRDQSFGV